MSTEPASMSKGGRGMRMVDPAALDFMRLRVEGRTDESLQRQFGLSYNSWRKLMQSLPVRASLADRIEARVTKLLAADPSISSE